MLNEVKDLIVDRLGIPAEEINENTDLLYGLGVDSLTLVSLVGDVEDHFSIAITDEDLAQLSTVGDLAALVASLKE